MSVAVAAVGTIIACAALAWHFTGDPSKSIARLSGERLWVAPIVTDVGAGKPGEIRAFTIELENLTDQPIRILGGTRSCTCVVGSDLPITIPARSSASIVVMAKFTGTPGRFWHRFDLLFASNTMMAKTASFRGEVITN